MEMLFKKELITPQELKTQYAMSETARHLKQERDNTLHRIFLRKDNRLLLIVGPCSADREDAILDYMTRLSAVQEKVKDTVFIVPRLYTSKPRTIGKGYKGIIHQPDPECAPDIMKGILAVRHLHLSVIEETGFSCADEMLYPDNHRYISDLLCYCVVGARSVEDQLHRMAASGLGIPVGMKNPTSGNLNVMLNAILTARAPQDFLYCGWEVQTGGNPFAHAILRGYEDNFGHCFPNYHYENLQSLLALYYEKHIEDPICIIDCNHANSGKHYLEQARICKDVLHSRNMSGDIRSLVRGLMVESYIEDGCQSPHEHQYGKSITDPCLGWKKTENLIYELAERWWC